MENKLRDVIYIIQFVIDQWCCKSKEPITFIINATHE